MTKRNIWTMNCEFFGTNKRQNCIYAGIFLPCSQFSAQNNLSEHWNYESQNRICKQEH